MVKNVEKGQPKDRLGSTRTKGIQHCVGSVCFNPTTGKLEVELKRDSCPPRVIKRIVEETIRGVEVEFLIPRSKK